VRVETLLQRLCDEQSRLAAEALTKPAARDVFEYGRVVGMHAGIEVAKQALLAMFDERDKRNFDL
jgi:hypothetical protein